LSRYVGGGADLFKGLAGRYRNGEVSAGPSFANARGMWQRFASETLLEGVAVACLIGDRAYDTDALRA
jgi:hypothetical protein